MTSDTSDTKGKIVVFRDAEDEIVVLDGRRRVRAIPALNAAGLVPTQTVPVQLAPDSTPRAAQPTPTPKVGRNDRCPCGSGSGWYVVPTDGDPVEIPVKSRELSPVEDNSGGSQ